MTKIKGKKIISILLAVVLFVSLIPTAFATETGETIILYTNDIHCAIDNYPVLAAYKAQLEAEGNHVILVDVGDAIQGEVIGTMTKGDAIVEIMNAVGYDYAVPGNHEYDYGMKTFLDIAENKADYKYLSANFEDLRSVKPVLDSYVIEEINGLRVAFIGMTTPETVTKANPEFFKDETGNFVYGFPTYDMADGVLTDCVQEHIDNATDDGADVVIALGHMGIEGVWDSWKSTDVIANTSGIDVFLDAHSHETISGDTYTDENGESVLLSSTGTKFAYFGQLTINDDMSVETELIDPDNIDVTSMSSQAKSAYDSVKEIVDGYNDEIGYLYDPIGTSEAELVVYDENGMWLVRKQETNTGDFVADAYRAVTGADIALCNGGGVRSEIAVGTVTRKALMDINPWSNAMCVIEVTGSQLADALEHGVREYPELSGSFPQVSGISFEFKTYVESPVIADQYGNFVSVDETKERRIQNIMINGEPLDPAKTYTLAGSEYVLLDGGDGMTMFDGAKIVQQGNIPVDSEMLIKYFTETLGGKITAEKYGNPNGEGRIKVIPVDPVSVCDHMCHEDGFVGFIWSIVNFFSRLFGLNPVCDCGMEHY